MHTERASRSLLQVRQLTVSYCGEGRCTVAVENLDFDVAPGEILGIQGRSGCGKTSTALALLKLLPRSAHVSGSAIFRGVDVLKLPEADLRRIRGGQISIIYQEPALALNPVMRVGKQIDEVLRAHDPMTAKDRARHVDDMLERVRLSPARFARAYPHELSGGERHRVVLAQALICRPALVIADEPTAGLDFRLKYEIVDLMAELRNELQTAILLISHDRGVISQLADRKLNAFEDEETRSPKSGSFPTAHRPATPHSMSSSQKNLLVARKLNKAFRQQGLFAFNGRKTQALDSVDIVVPQATIVGLIGASGSGKSTLAKCLALLEQLDSGEIVLGGRNLLALPKKELRAARRSIQYVPQDPAMALNPRFSAVTAIEEPLLIEGWGTKEERRTRARSLMESVGLDPNIADRSCLQFSGGQKQRIAIARALSLNPKLIIFDESLSGLDPETQRDMTQLLVHLKTKLAISQILISHDLHFVRGIADSVIEISEGRIVEANAPANSAASSAPTRVARLADVPERELMEVE